MLCLLQEPSVPLKNTSISCVRYLSTTHFVPAPATKSAHGGSQSAVPATKSAHGGSQSAAPATKSAHGGSQSAVPATKSAHGGSQSAAPATKSAHGGSQSAAPATKSALQETSENSNPNGRTIPSMIRE